MNEEDKINEAIPAFYDPKNLSQTRQSMMKEYMSDLREHEHEHEHEDKPVTLDELEEKLKKANETEADQNESDDDSKYPGTRI